MPTYDSARFPDEAAMLAVGGPTFVTSVVTLGGGDEQRNGRSGRHARRRFQINTGAFDETTYLAALRDFFSNRRGSNDSFRFRDPFDYRATNQPIVSTAAGPQLVKRYTVGPLSYDRPITKPVSGTVSFSGGGTLDYETGVVSGNIGGTWTGEFDIQARLDGDALSDTAINYQAYGFQLSVVEVWDSDIPAVANTEHSSPLNLTWGDTMDFGLQRIAAYRTQIFTTGLMEERTTDYSSGESRLVWRGQAHIQDLSVMDPTLAFFLIARGRLKSFAWQSATYRFGSDDLVLRRTGHDTWAADVSFVQVTGG